MQLRALQEANALGGILERERKSPWKGLERIFPKIAAASRYCSALGGRQQEAAWQATPQPGQGRRSSRARLGAARPAAELEVSAPRSFAGGEEALLQIRPRAGICQRPASSGPPSPTVIDRHRMGGPGRSLGRWPGYSQVILRGPEMRCAAKGMMHPRQLCLDMAPEWTRKSNKALQDDCGRHRRRGFWVMSSRLGERRLARPPAVAVDTPALDPMGINLPARLASHPHCWAGRLEWSGRAGSRPRRAPARPRER